MQGPLAGLPPWPKLTNYPYLHIQPRRRQRRTQSVRQVIEQLERQYSDRSFNRCSGRLGTAGDRIVSRDNRFYFTTPAYRHRRVCALARLGSPLGPAITRPDGTLYRSGTEREFDLMLAAFEHSGRHRPIIFAYTREDDAGFRQRLAIAPKNELSNSSLCSKNWPSNSSKSNSAMPRDAISVLTSAIASPSALPSGCACRSVPGAQRSAGRRRGASLERGTLPGAGSLRRRACGHLLRSRRRDMRRARTPT